MRNLKKPKSIIFDWDNTLASTWNSTYKILNHVFSELGMESWSMEKVKKSTHLSAKDFFPEIFKEKTEEAIAILRRHVREGEKEQLAELSLMEGALELLNTLNQGNIDCAILSNKYGERLRLEVDHLGLNNHFIGIYGSNDFKEDKPSALPALSILKKYNWDPNSTWFVGDTPVDWACARNSGCIPISVLKESSELEKDHIFDGCLDIEKYIG